MRHKEILIDVGNVDWKLLRKQKLTLIKLHDKTKSMDVESLEGILNLIDSIQDQAAEQIGERKVFGKTCLVRLLNKENRK